MRQPPLAVRKADNSPATGRRQGTRAAAAAANRPGGTGYPGISARLTATMARRCCSGWAGNRNHGPSLLRQRLHGSSLQLPSPAEQHRCPIVAAAGPGDSGRQKSGCPPVGGQFESRSAISSSLNVTGRLSCGSMLPRRFRCSGLAALRSGSACPRMTSGFCRRQLRLPAGMVPELAVADGSRHHCR